MRDFCIRESGIYAGFLIRDNRTVELTHFTYEGDKALKEVHPKEAIYHPILEIQETGKSSRELHGYKHNVCSASLDYKYQGHTLLENDWGRLLMARWSLFCTWTWAMSGLVPDSKVSTMEAWPEDEALWLDMYRKLSRPVSTSSMVCTTLLSTVEAAAPR